MQILQSVFWLLLPWLLGVSASMLFQISFFIFFSSSSEIWVNSDYKIVSGQTISRKGM